MRFKKMHLGLLVIALSLVLGSSLNTLPEVKAGSGLQYYYSFETGWNTYEATNDTYQHGNDPITSIHSQVWNNLDGWGLNERMEMSGTGLDPEFVAPPVTGPRKGSYSLSLIDTTGSPADRFITPTPPDTDPVRINHYWDISDRVQFNLIPYNKPGFTHKNEFYLGFSMMIPKNLTSHYLEGDPFAPNPDGQWIQLFTMHAKPDSSAFQIDVASDGVTNDTVKLKARSFTLSCTFGNMCSSPASGKDWEIFNGPAMERGVWYDFLIQAKMGSYIYVKMKKKDESWADGQNPYGHLVYSYDGKIGFDETNPNVDKSLVSYFPKITLYRDKVTDPTKSPNYRARIHTIYIDEVRVGTDGGGWPAAVIP